MPAQLVGSYVSLRMCPHQSKAERDVAHAEEKMMRWKQTSRRCGHRPRDAKGCWQCQDPEEAKNEFSPRASGGSTALPTHWFSNIDIQNNERINSCFKPGNLWTLGKAAIGNEHTLP